MQKALDWYFSEGHKVRVKGTNDKIGYTVIYAEEDLVVLVDNVDGKKFIMGFDEEYELIPKSEV